MIATAPSATKAVVRMPLRMGRSGLLQLRPILLVTGAAARPERLEGSLEASDIGGGGDRQGGVLRGHAVLLEAGGIAPDRGKRLFVLLLAAGREEIFEMVK